jgi:hypothetical protein
MTDPDALLDIARRLERSGPAGPQRADDFSLILHDLRMGGAWKRTNPGRLRRTEEMLCEYISPALRPLTFLDLGASDGITTVEAVRALRRAFGEDVRALLADVNLSLLRYRRGPIVEYRAADGEPIMVRAGPLGVRLAKPRRGVPSGDNLLARLYLRMKQFRRSMHLDVPISLVHPLARGEPGITVTELDCLVFKECLKDRIAAIRASNVLNLGYFARPQLHRAIGHLHGYMREGGCLVVSRNDDQPHDEPEDGSVWLRDGCRFRWLRDFGAGSEVKSMVDGWRPS